MPKSKGKRRPSRTVAPPPVREDQKVSATWYVVLMFTLMAAGVIVIILNYIGAVPGGQASRYLYGGLGAIGIGFMMTLNYH